MASSSERSILLMSRSERLRMPSAHVLRSAGHRVEEVSSPTEARSWLRMHRADLAVLDLDTDSPTDRERLQELVAGLQSRTDDTQPRSLGLTRSTDKSAARKLLKELKLMNFLSVGEGEVMDPVELGVTASKILTGDIFGFQRYLSAGVEVRAFSVRRSSDIRELVSVAERFALEAGCHRLAAQNVAVAVDELLTNAVYNAPADASGAPKYEAVSRATPIELLPSEEVTFQLATDGRRLGVSAGDPFGRLSPTRVLEFLARCLDPREQQIQDKPGGAGLGLFTLFTLVHHFVLNVAPSRRTEVVALVEISRSYRQFSSRPKSFNVFVQEG